MANSDKNIRIQPNRNSTLFPKITFTGQSNNPITLNVLDDNSISFEGSAGQLFSINNNLSSGYIFSVNDISGLPSFRINADGTVGIAEFFGNVGIGITNPSYKFHARGDSYFSSTGNTALLLLSGTGGTIIASNSVNITLTDPARKGLVINAATSQSANLLEWYADGGVGGGYSLSGRIRPSGHVNLGNPGTITMSTGTSALLSLQGRGSTEGLAIRGFNSAAFEPLFEIQGNPGNQLFGIYGDGGVNAPRINVTNGTASTSTSSGALIVTGGVGIGGTLNVNNIGIGYTGIPYNPSIAFIGTTGDPIRLNVLSNNTLSFEGRSGQLFSINNNLSSGWIFSVNDISGIPLFRANADATISMAEYAGNVGIGLSNPTFKFQVNGSASIGATLNVNRLKVTSKITFEPGTGTSAVSGWSGIGLTSLFRMIYGGGRFIGIGGSYVAYSTDGINFTYTTIPGSTSAANYYDIAYGNGVYVAGNRQDTPFIAYSYDGASWGTTSLPRGLISNVCFGNGKFLAFNEAPDVVYSSTDGRNWSAIGNIGQFGREAFFANGYFLSTRGNNLWYSVDGVRWKQATIPVSQFIFSAAYGKGLYIAPEYNSAILHTSTDLFTWTQRSIPNLVWTGASYVNGVFYIIPNNDPRLYHSLDGINWSSTNFGINIGGTNKMFTANDRLYLFTGATLWSTDATTGTLMAKPFYNGELENTRIGAVNPDSATFTHLAALNPVNFTSATASTGTDSGALIVKGGVGIGGTTNLNTLRVNQDLVFTPTTGTIATAGGLLTANFPSFASAGSSMTRTVTFGNGRFVGSAGTSIIWSEDAINWNRVNTPFTSVTMISQIAYGNGTWVATKYDAGTELIYSTNNGNSWSTATIPYASSPTLVFGNGIFVLGSPQYTGISTNGINWSTYTPSYFPDRFINGFFYSKTHRSADGYNWQTLNTPASNAAISYGNGLYFAAEYNSANYYISYDGVNFSTTTIGNAVHLNSAYYNGVYYLVTQHNNALLKYSTDGFNYTNVFYPNGSTNYGIAYGNNKIVFFNNLYTEATNYIYYAEASFGKANIQPFREGTIDNVTIGSRIPQAGTFNNVSVLKNINVNSNFQSVSSNTGALTVLGGAGIGQTLSVGGSVNISNSLNLVNTTTGIATTWTRTVVGTAATISYLAYANNLYVGVGYSSLTSTDGVNWTTRTLPNDLSFVSYGNGIWSGLLFNSALGATSTNGTSWTSYAMTNSRQWTMMAFGNGKFVTLARNTNIAAYSTNGYNWTEVTMPTNQIWVWVTYGGGYFVAVANGSATAVYSADGINWNITTLPSASGWNCITYGNGYYFATGSGNNGAYSKDLINWTNYPLNVNPGNSLFVSYNNGTFEVHDSLTTNSNIITGDFSTRTSVAIPFSQPLGQSAAGDRVFIAGYGQTFYTFPIPNNSITLNPNTTGEINNVEIGAIKPAAGNFSNIYSQNIAAIGSTIRSTSPYNGALTVLGGAGIAGTLNANSVVTYNRLQNQSFSGSSVGTSDGRMINYDGAYQYQSTGNGVIVATSWGAYNARYTNDGLTWQVSTLPVNQGYPINFFGNGYFVLSASGSTTVLYSTNGSSWSQVSIGNTEPRSSGAYGNGKYVIVGSGTTYNYSTNLTSWNTGTLPLTGDWRIAYGNGMFVALAYGTNRLIYSYDAINWNVSTIDTINRNFMKITYTNGKFMVTAWSSGGTWYSEDGINWFVTSNGGGDVVNLSYGNGVYFTNDSLRYTYSSDGFNWSSLINFSAGYEAFQSVYAFNKFITVGRVLDGPTNTVTIEPKFTGEINNVRIGAVTPSSGDFTNLSSTGSANLVGTVNANNLNILSKVNQTPVLGGFAGTTGWTSANLLSGAANNALAFGNGLFVSIRRGTDSTSFSSDGKRWTASTMPFVGQWNDVAWGKDKFVAVAGVGTTGAFSGNGISWSSMNMPATAEGWYAVTYGDDKFVAVGNTSTSAYSSNGINWSGSSIANTNWTGIAYGNGTFVAIAGVGQSGAYSYDGISWNYVNLPSATGGASTKFITYGNGYFVVTNYVSNDINYSRDGINWSTSVRTSTYGIKTDIAYGNGIYSIFNYQEATYSYDGVNWLLGNTIAATDWQAVAYGNNRFVATSINTGQVGSIDGPSNTLNLYPKFTGDIDNVRIGAKQPAAAEFTNLAAQQPVRFTANTTSTDSNSGSLVVLGGVGIGGTVYQRGSLHSGPISAPSIYQIGGSGLTGSLTPSTIYYYVVTALDFDGRESTASNQVSVNTSTNTSVLMRWNRVPGARQYRVYRSTVSGVFENTFIRTTKLDEFSFFYDYGFNTSTGSPPASSQAYTNKISFNTSNTSATGNILHGVNIPSGSLSVNSKNDSPLTAVEITGDAAFTRLAPGTSVSASTGGTLTPGTIYYYRHSFVDSRGVESLASEPVPFQAPAGGAINVSWPIEAAHYQVGRIYRSTNIDSWTNTLIAETTANGFLDINYPQLNSSPVTTSSSHSNSFISNTTNYSVFTNLALSAGRTNIRRVNAVPTITASTSTAAGTLLTNTTYYYKAVFVDHLGGVSRFGPEIAINTGIGTAINLSMGIGSNQGLYLYRSTTPNFTSGARFFTTGSITDDGSINNSTSINSDPQNGVSWNLGFSGNLLPFNLNVSSPSNGFGLGILTDTPIISNILNGSVAGTLTTGTRYYYRVVGNDAFGQPTSASQISSAVAPAIGSIYLAVGYDRGAFASFDVYRSTDPNNFSNTYIGNFRNNYFTDFGYATSSGSPRESSNIAKDIYLRGVNDYGITTRSYVSATAFILRSSVPVINTAYSIAATAGSLSNNTDYYYKIRAHFFANSTYGELSDPYKVNTGSNSAIYINWSVINGAQHYTLYRSTNPKDFTNATVIYGIKDNYAYDFGHSVSTETPVPNYNGSNDAFSTDIWGARLSGLRIVGDNQFLKSLFDAPKFSTYPTSTTGGTLANNTTFFYTVVALGYYQQSSMSSSEIRVNTGSNNAVSLNWLNVNGATGYNIYRSTTLNSWTNTLIASDVKSNSFIDINYPTTTGTPNRVSSQGVGVAQSLFENNYNILARTIFGSVNSVDSAYQNFTVRINGNIFRNSSASTLQVGTGFTNGYTFNGSSNGTELAIASGTGFTGSLFDAHSNGTSRFRINFDGSTNISTSTASTSSSTGALIVSGGVGIGGSLNIGSDVIINGGRESNSTSTGSLIVRGGVGVTGGLYVKPFSLSTKGLVVQANTSQSGNLFELQSSASSTITSFNSAGELNITSTTGSTSASFGSIVTAGGVGIGGSVSIGSTAGSASTTSGALKVVGGVGIGGALNVGGSVNFSSSIFGGVSTSIVPTMTFIGQANDPITLSVLSDNSLSFDGSSGQLFSINNNLSTGWIFSISDISGLPLFRTNADGTVSMGEFGGNVGIGLTNPSYKLQVAGKASIGDTLFVTGNAHIGSLAFTDLFGGSYSPSITLTNDFAGDMVLQIQNKSTDITARAGLLLLNDADDYATLYMNSSDYAGTASSNFELYSTRPVVINSSSVDLSVSSTPKLLLRDTALTVTPTTESTSTTSGSLIINGGAGIAKSVNIGGFLSSKPAYVTAGLASDQTILSSSDTLLIMTDNTDPNGWWTGTAAIGVSHIFKPNIQGVYYVSLQVHFKTGTGSGQINIQARKNSTSFAFAQDAVNTSEGRTLNLSGAVSLNGSTDYIDFTAYSAATTSQDITGDAARSYTQATIYKLF